MQQQNPDIQQAAQWLHSNSIPQTIPHGSTYLRTLWHQRAYLTMRDGKFYTDIGKMFQEVEHNPGYSSFSHHI